MMQPLKISGAPGSGRTTTLLALARAAADPRQVAFITSIAHGSSIAHGYRDDLRSQLPEGVAVFGAYNQLRLAGRLFDLILIDDADELDPARLRDILDIIRTRHATRIRGPRIVIAGS